MRLKYLGQVAIRDHDGPRVRGQSLHNWGTGADEIAKTLSDTKCWHSHGQMSSHENAASLGVAYLEPREELWTKSWRLY